MKSILNKRVSFTVYELPPYLKGLSKTEINERILEKEFGDDLKPVDTVDTKTGFINPVNFSEKAECYTTENFLVFSVRTDEYSFSSGQKRPFIEREEFEYKRINNVEYVPAYVKKEIKEEVHKMLKTKNMPKPSFVEFFIDSLKEKIVIMSTSTKVLNRVVSLIESAFMSVPDLISLKKILYKNSDAIKFLACNKTFMFLGTKFGLATKTGGIKTDSFDVVQDLISAESGDIPILTSAELVFEEEKDTYKVFIDDSVNMKSVAMPMCVISEPDMVVADRMTKILIIWEVMENLVKDHTSNL